jgi:hypothetical protein
MATPYDDDREGKATARWREVNFRSRFRPFSLPLTTRVAGHRRASELTFVRRRPRTRRGANLRAYPLRCGRRLRPRALSRCWRSPSARRRRPFCRCLAPGFRSTASSPYCRCRSSRRWSPRLSVSEPCSCSSSTSPRGAGPARSATCSQPCARSWPAVKSQSAGQRRPERVEPSPPVAVRLVFERAAVDREHVERDEDDRHGAIAGEEAPGGLVRRDEGPRWPASAPRSTVGGVALSRRR